MHYNLRLIEYPNGEVQIRYYSNPMYKSDELPQELELKKKKVKKELYELTHSQEPFSNTWVKEVNSFEDLEKNDSVDFMRSFRSLNRTKQAIYSYARCEKWEWFVTWTLDPDLKNRYNYDVCSSAIRIWLHNQKARYAPDLKYLVVPEHHKDGAWHFHGLLCNAGDMSFKYSGVKDKKGNMLFNLDSYTLGFTTATRVKDYHRVAKYIGKYITKDLATLTFGRQSYFVSKRIRKPDSSIMLWNKSEEDLNDFINIIAASFGLELKHASSTGSDKTFTKVSYFELQ